MFSFKNQPSSKLRVSHCFPFFREYVMYEYRFHRTRLAEHVLRREKQQVLRKSNETETGLVQPEFILIKEGHKMIGAVKKSQWRYGKMLLLLR